MKNKIYTPIMQPKISYAKTKEPVSFAHKKDLDFKSIEVNEPWGDLFDCAWFRIAGHIEKTQKDDLYLKFDVSGEALLFNENGDAVKGFTNGSSVFDRKHGEPGKLYYKLNSLIKDDGSFECYLDAGANDLFGNLQDQGKIIAVEVVSKNENYNQLYFDLSTLFDMLTVFEDNKEQFDKLFYDLKEIYYLVIYNKPDWLKETKKIVDVWLAKSTTSPLKIYATGHAHMDLAWLWPIRETKRKIGRTISNVIYLLETYPDFIFGISQPQQMVWLEEEYPTLFKKFAYYIEQGRIELQGGMWVEADTNLSGGESLIRQFYYGMDYYKTKFNKTVDNLWLPDVFGYNGNLPQIIKKCGLSNFMTIKLSWSLVNRFPYHSFNWEGIDDSKVICHMPP
ncbi:hypothetical protein KHQ89_05910 [Mycoplasmatota bacterium]|nr:hypothetical protein KHQ89_05910 [Mycoplasmatota bacterium]